MKNILIIDNQNEVLNLLRLALSMRGFCVEIALGGPEGIKKLNDGNFDLVITEINMPKCNGSEICEYIRSSSTPDIPVIGLWEKSLALTENYFDKIIQKPYALKWFLEEVHKLLKEKDEQINKDMELKLIEPARYPVFV
jgi:DNA-binding response OmpR family regulator